VRARAAQVLQELKDLFDSLPRDVQRDIKLVELPMADAGENSLIVNAIQRASNVVVQCSVKVGGLRVDGRCASGVCFNDRVDGSPTTWRQPALPPAALPPAPPTWSCRRASG
jgi:hypothetical protein